jgi:hypothetical protein
LPISCAVVHSGGVVLVYCVVSLLTEPRFLG